MFWISDYPIWFGKHRFDRLLQLAKVAVPILGVDFLRQNNFFLDVANQRVYSADCPTAPSINFQTSRISFSVSPSANLLAVFPAFS